MSRLAFYLLSLVLLPALVFGQAIDQRKVGFYIANKAGNDCSQSVLELADDAALAAGQTLVLPPTDRFGNACQWLVSSNLTIDSPVFFPYNATPVLQVAAGVTLTLAQCPVVWSDHYIIDADGATVTYTPGCSQCTESGPDNFTSCTVGGGGSGTGDITDVFNCASGNCSSIALSDGDYLDMSSVDPTTTTEGLRLPNASVDCSAAVELGQVCVDPSGNLWLGDGAQSNQVASLGVPTLEEVIVAGRVVTTLNSQANAMDLSDGSDGFRIYTGTGGPKIECYIGAGTCDIIDDIPSGNSYHLRYAGTEGITIDSSGNVTLSNNLIETKSMWFGAGALSTDETQCTVPVERTINSGPRVWVVNCADNAGSIFYGSVAMPDAYSGGTITFELQAQNENATPSGALNFDFSAMCRSDGDVLSSTWGAAVEAAMTFATQFAVEHVTTAAVTPNGTCQPGDTLMWRAVMDATATTTQTSNTYILGAKLEYPTNKWTD